jgi:glycosyltransferase involved in cell wall biosynthesis
LPESLPELTSYRSDFSRYESVWIVVPAYNEGKRLGSTLTGLSSWFPRVIVVDDGSCDNTLEVSLQFPVWVLRHITNCGQGAALQTGIEFALRQGAKAIVTFDSDGQHNPDDLPILVEPILSGRSEVVLGSRFLGSTEGLPASRLILLKLGVVFTRIFSGIRISDTHNGLRALSRTAAEQIQITQDRMAHASEILDQIKRLHLRFEEVPVQIRYSQETLAKGQSSWNALKIAGQLLLGRLIR